MGTRNGIFFALEDDQVSEEVAPESVPETTPEVEAETAQVSEQVADVTQATEDIDAAIDGTDEISQVQATIQPKVDDGEGIDTTSQQLAQAQVESICNRLGLRNVRPFPSTESFGSKHTRLSATKIAVEGIVDVLKKIWEGIKAAISRLWQKIKSFFLGLFKSTKKLGEHLASIKKRVDALPSEAKMEKDTIENGSLAKAFSGTGTNKTADFKTATAVLANSVILLGAQQPIADRVAQASHEVVGKVLSGAANSTAGADSAAMDAINDVIDTKVLCKLGAVPTAQKGKQNKAGYSTKATYYGPFYNSQVISASLDTPTATGGVKRFYIGMESVDKWECDKIKTLKREEMYTILKAGLDLVDGLGSNNKFLDGVEKVSKACEDAASKVLQAVTSASEKVDTDPARSRALKDLAGTISDCNGMVGKLGGSFPNIIYGSCKASGDYVLASLAEYKKKDKK